MINRTVLIGRLTKEPELKYTKSGKAVLQVTLAVNRQFTNGDGNREADFINCILWGKRAVNFEKFTHKGSLVGFEGHIQTRYYDPGNGEKRVYITEVIVDNFSLLESKSENERHRNQSEETLPADNTKKDDVSEPYDYDYNHKNKINDSFDNNSKPIDISDDDLPF